MRTLFGNKLKLSIWASLVLAGTFVTVWLIMDIDEDKYLADNYSGFVVEHGNAHLHLFNGDSRLLKKGKIDRESIQQLYEKNFKSRLSDYENNKAQLTSIMRLLLGIAIIGVILLFYRPKSLRLPIAAIEIPDSLLYPCIAMSLLYLWMQFGFTLNAGIDSRLALESMVEYAECFSDKEVNDPYSNRHILVDNGILDSWAQHYHRRFDRSVRSTNSSWSPHDVLAWISLYVGYGTFMGFIHACCFALIATIHDKKGRIKLTSLLYYITLLIFLLSSVGFLYEFNYATALIAWNWGATCVLLLLWKWQGIHIANAYEIRRKNKVGTATAA